MSGRLLIAVSLIRRSATPPRIPENRDLCDALDDSSSKKEGALELRASRHC